MPRKEIPNIDGVKRGSDFFKGKTIEMAGQELASRRRVGFGETSLDLCLIKTSRAIYKDMPSLGREIGDKGGELWEPRVDPGDGSVTTWRWMSLTAGETNFFDYVPFAGRKINAKYNLGQLPPEWTIGVLIPQKIKEGIEAAMRQQDEIAHDYRMNAGPEKVRVDETFDLLYDTSSAFAMNEVNGVSDLNELAITAENHFKIHGLLDSRDTVWQRVVEYTLKAAEKDRRNHINPLVSRVRVRAAFLAATQREMIARSVGDKAEKVYNYLALTRAGIRLKIRMVADTLDDLCGFSRGKLPQDPIMLESGQISNIERGSALEQDLKAISGDILGSIQPAPYLLHATVARIILAGEMAFKNSKDRETALRILKGNNYIKFLDNSAIGWLWKGRPYVAKSRIHLAHGLLNQSLRDPETFDTKVFD